MTKKAIIPAEKIDRAIILLRNKRVMLDADLAMVFGTTTKRLNEKSVPPQRDLMKKLNEILTGFRRIFCFN